MIIYYVKKIILAACLILLASSLRYAQENNAEFGPMKWGITLAVPVWGGVEIGGILHVTHNIAIAPMVYFDHIFGTQEDKLAATKINLAGDSATLTKDYGINLGIFYYTSPITNMALFVGPFADLGIDFYKTSGDVVTIQDYSLLAFGGGVRLGAVYMITRR